MFLKDEEFFKESLFQLQLEFHDLHWKKNALINTWFGI